MHARLRDIECLPNIEGADRGGQISVEPRYAHENHARCRCPIADIVVSGAGSRIRSKPSYPTARQFMILNNQPLPMSRSRRYVIGRMRDLEWAEADIRCSASDRARSLAHIVTPSAHGADEAG